MTSSNSYKLSTRDNSLNNYENYAKYKDLENRPKILDKNILGNFQDNSKAAQSPYIFKRETFDNNISENKNKPNSNYGKFDSTNGTTETKNKYALISKIDKNGKDSNNNLIKTPNISTKTIYNSKVGLDNLGNTCFMNTSLQCLIHSEPFMSRFLAEKEKYFGVTSVRSTPISRGFYELCNMIFEKNDSSKGSIAPFDFKRLFSQAHRNFIGYHQHDSQEFLRLLLQDISEELNKIVNIPKYTELDTSSSNKKQLNLDFDNLFRSREESIVIDTFYGQIANIFKCIACNYETYSFEKFYDIPLLIESESFSGIILSDLLKEFFNTEKFDWDTPCENKRCRKKISHEKSLKLTILPEILVLCLQRYNNRTNKKNCSRIKILETLDMSDYIDRECTGIIKLNFYRIL